jgi:hypothetical protein
MNQLTMILETGHRSSILILGSSSSFVLQLLLHEFILKLEAKLKGWDNNGLGNLAEFPCYDFFLL